MILKIKKILKTTLFKTATIYAGTNILNRAIPFLLLPILTRYLSAEDYGIVSMFGVLLSVLTSLVGVNTHGAIARTYYDKTKEELKDYISSTLMILLFSVSFISIIFLIGGQYIASLSSLPTIMLWVALLIAVAQFISRVTLVLWQVQKQAIQYGIFNFGKSTSNVLLSILFVVGLGFAWQGRIYAQLIAGIIFLLIATAFLMKNDWLGKGINKNDFIDSLKFGIPLIPVTIGTILITMVDRFFITYYLDIGQTGIYTVGYQIGMIISVLTTSFNIAYVPWVYEKLKLNSITVKKKIVKFTYIYFIVILLASLILTLASNFFLPIFIGNRFKESSIYVGWIAFGYSFQGMYLMVNYFFYYIKKTVFLLISTIFTAIINILLNILLIPKHGAIGAAYATTIAYFVQFIVAWFIISRIYYMPWNKFLKK